MISLRPQIPGPWLRGLNGYEVINPWRLGEATKDLCRFNYLWFFLLRPQFIKVDHNLLLLT